MTFERKHFASSSELNSFGMRYRAMLKRRPFLLFGLPFLAVIVAGSFVLTPATAVRYEKHDRKVRQLTREEELGIHRGARKVDMREEYYVSFCLEGSSHGCGETRPREPHWTTLLTTLWIEAGG